MQRLSRRLRGQPERGASAVIVAIVMLVLIGFTGLGVDVTAAYAKSQEVQNAADAAALGAAQECAQGDVDCTVGAPAFVRAMAERLATENVLTPVEDVVVDPAVNRVTVEVTAQHQNFFAGAFGVDSFTVVRAATAQWDAPQAGPAMLPLTFSACTFFNQAGEPGLNTPVTIYMPNSNNGNGNGPQPAGCPNQTYPPGGFGWLDATNDCQSEVLQVGEWYETGSAPGNGAAQCVRNLLSALIDEVVLIPIYSAKTGQGENARYFIEQFAAFEVAGFELQSGNVSGGAACAATPSPTNAYTKTCLTGRFVDWVELGEDYSAGAPTDDVSLVRLVDPDYDYNN